MKLKSSVTLLFLIFSSVTSSQQLFDSSKISDEINESVESLAEYGKFNFYHTFPIKPTSPFVIFHSATIEELTELLKHPNPVIRCYAFSELTAHPSVDLLPIILEHLNDNGWVDTDKNKSNFYRVGDVFIQSAAYKKKYMASLTMPQRAELDRSLIFSPNELVEKSLAVERAQTSQYSYTKLRKSYLAENNQAALVVLAKYQNEKDVPLIINNLENSSYLSERYVNSYKAMSEFPRVEFIPFFEEFLEKNLQGGLFHFKEKPRKYLVKAEVMEAILMKALINYRDKHVIILELLRTPLQYYTNKSSDNLEYFIDIYKKLIYEESKTLRTPINDELLWLFWSEQNIITEKVFYYLLKKDSKRVFNLSLKTVQGEDALNSDFFRIWHDHGRKAFSSDDRYKFMVNFILEQDKALGIELIRKGISGESSNLLLISCSMAAEIKDQSLIEPLETRLKNTTNPYWRKSITEALSAYEK